ncbi:photosystem II protein M [Iris pallida]|uniref:Photosystem II protein M (Plastid) n=1 Tax=Iris pallida TaxID=29817 RepID=A0AAX6E8Z5_IRIPA|nr:photosystem II protein M [Iris pallida]
MISKKAVGTKLNSAVAIGARILTSIIFFFSFHNNSGSNPIDMINLTPINSMG